MDDKDIRQTTTTTATNQCTLGAQTGPQTIIVRQVVGEKEQQKVLDIHVVVPDRKPAIEQIVDVFVKEVEVNSVDVITDKVIVRGDFEIKAIYVACLPDQPVHAVEIKNYKFTQDIVIAGARKGMDADATVVVEFVDFDIADDMCRAYKHKYMDMSHECHHDCDDGCGNNHIAETAGATAAVTNMEDECTREFDVSVVLKITAKVLSDREVQIGAVSGATGTPKG